MSDDAGSPVVPPEPDDEPQVVPELLALAQRVKGSPVVPAATDEPALAVIRDAIFHNSSLNMAGAEKARSAVVAALEADGYVVLPRKELDDLLAAVTFAHVHQNRPAWALLLTAHEAVVEAVGPTREEP